MASFGPGLRIRSFLILNIENRYCRRGTLVSADSTIHIPGATYSVPYSETIFGHWLTFYLYDAAPAEDASNPNKPLWIGEISCHTHSSDLREIISPMLVAAFEHFGQNTHKRIRETIKITDRRLKQLNSD